MHTGWQGSQREGISGILQQHEGYDEGDKRAQDGGAPNEGQPECGPRRAVDAEVEQESAHGRDDHERGHREALEAERRHAVDGPQEEAERVERRDRAPEVGRRDTEAGRGQADAQRPRRAGGQLTCGACEEREASDFLVRAILPAPWDGKTLFGTVHNIRAATHTGFRCGFPLTSK